MHVHTCRSFSVVGLNPDSKNKIDSDCIYQNETIEQNDDFDNIPTGASKSSQRKSLNRNGYELVTHIRILFLCSVIVLVIKCKTVAIIDSFKL